MKVYRYRVAETEKASEKKLLDNCNSVVGQA